MRLTEKEKELARESYEALTAQTSKLQRRGRGRTVVKSGIGKGKTKNVQSVIRLIITGKPTSITLPEKAIEALKKVLAHLAKGKEVSITAKPDELTTQKAADFLHVSRPFLVGLLEKGEIPFHKVGTHRRIRFSDLQAYKERIDAKRLQALEELTKQAQELNMGY